MCHNKQSNAKQTHRNTSAIDKHIKLKTYRCASSTTLRLQSILPPRTIHPPCTPPGLYLIFTTTTDWLGTIAAGIGTKGREANAAAFRVGEHTVGAAGGGWAGAEGVLGQRCRDEEEENVDWIHLYNIRRSLLCCLHLFLCYRLSKRNSNNNVVCSPGLMEVSVLFALFARE